MAVLSLLAHRVVYWIENEEDPSERFPVTRVLLRHGHEWIIHDLIMHGPPLPWDKPMLLANGTHYTQWEDVVREYNLDGDEDAEDAEFEDAG